MPTTAPHTNNNVTKQNFIIPAAVLIIALLIGVGTRSGVQKLSAPPEAPVVKIEVANADQPEKEFVTITIEESASGPLMLTGLALLQDHFLVPIEKSVKKFVRGNISSARAVVVETFPTTIIVNSGRSPAGVSFKVNRCSGFLEEFQNFHPPLVTDCPSINTLLAKQSVTISEECRDYFEKTPSCTSLPDDAPTQCSYLLIEHIGYNQCVDAVENDTDFYKNEWRLFLESPKTLWATTSPIELIDPSTTIRDQALDTK